MSHFWMITSGGQDYRLNGPQALLGNAPRIEDIAHHLAIINRYTGATHRPYSVAEHSLLTERIARRRGASPIVRLACLMHDAHEAYAGDMSSPAKQCVGIGWTAFESIHAVNVRQHFGLKTAFASHRAEIHMCDLIALATERRDLTAFDPQANDPWPVLDTPGREVAPCDETLDADEPPLCWRAMRAAFIDRYLMLRGQIEVDALKLRAPPTAAQALPATHLVPQA